MPIQKKAPYSPQEAAIRYTESHSPTPDFSPRLSPAGGEATGPRCDHWFAGCRCAGAGTLILFAPDGARVPGGPICTDCAHAITTEYREKLGEVWTTRLAEARP